MKQFKKSVYFLLATGFFWLGYFVFARLFFLLYHFEKTKELGFFTSLKTFFYGLQLDISFASYISIVCFFSLTISKIIFPKIIFLIIHSVSYFTIILISLLLFIDAGLYQAWGIRLDTTFLDYLNTPHLMISSVSKTQLFAGLIGWILVSFVFIKLYKKFVQQKSVEIVNVKWQQFPVFLLITSLLIIPIRGGFQTIPVNQSNVYFSKNMFANHAAVNFSWNFFNSITHKTDGNPYVFLEDNIAKKSIQDMRNNLLTAPKDSILNTSKPNIILIIWESLTAKVVGSLGGEPEVTPNLNRLSEEGLLFTNFYANGDRTDKGIPAILSGYYPQPIKKIMRMPNKTRSLTMLPKKMVALGYEVSYYYGGDLNFGNMNTYLRNGGINQIVDGSEFDEKDWNSKWGAYDGVFMQRFAADLATPQQTPFFKIALTLTSHEPYEIQGNYKFGKKTEENLFRSAHYYTDSVIGKFIDFAKKQAWYDNTLIVIMADHGHSLPKHKGPHFSPKKFHIPMLWIGGALKNPATKNDIVSSQVDFSYSLLQLLDGDVTGFDFGKNIFLKNENQYAYYNFNKGFGIVTKNDVFVFDYVSKKPIMKAGNNTERLDSLGKAITQLSFQDFLNRK